MERLTERTENGGIQYEDRNGYYHTFYGNGAGDPVHALAKKLCELEDKIEQGTLIELPCPIGTMVYYIASYEKKIGLFGKRKYCYTIMEIPFELEMLGTYKNCWFLTREEAEKRLKEIQE